MFGIQLQGETPLQLDAGSNGRTEIETFPMLAGLPFFAREEQPAPRIWSISKQGIEAGPNPSPATPAEDLQGRITGPVRLVQQIAHAWSLTNSELVNLLAYPSEGLVSALLDGRITFWPETDRGDRVRVMYFIHSTLADVFVEPAQEGRWMREPLDDLEGMSPLNCMLKNRIPGMLTVRAFVEQRLANR
jgi:hypothetical protein